MDRAAAGSLLYQDAPAVITPVAAFTATVRTEITHIRIIELLAGTPTVTLNHEDTGAAAAAANQILGFAMTANQNYIEKCEVGSGLMISPGGILYVQTSVVSSIAFSIYGITETTAPAGRVRT